ncbi:MAG: RnfABCDGE type electron transport complex subunit G [Desulfobacterales bacterium]
MREMIKMVVVLTVLSSFSGGLLAAIHSNTKERIQYQQLKFVKGPAIRTILEGSSNDPIVDRFKLPFENREESFFVGIFENIPSTVAFEVYGKGYGGDIGVMVGVNLTDDAIVGVNVTTHGETPGVGSRAKSDPTFVNQFKGLSIIDNFKVKTDGGQVDAMSGATLTCRGVSYAVTEAGKLYKELKPQITANLKRFSK